MSLEDLFESRPSQFDAGFETFILKQMSRAGISPSSSITIFRQYRFLFERAFTHKSASTKHYDMLEAYGDHVLNTALFDILWTRFPELDQKTITSAFHKAKSEETLAREGVKEGFYEHVLMSADYKRDTSNWRDNAGKDTFVPNSTKYDSFAVNPNENLHVKLLEDTVESFCGALCKAVNEWGDCKIGPGAEVVYRWAIPIIDNLGYDPTDISVTRNTKQQLKEFWDMVYVEDIVKGKRMSNFAMFYKDPTSRPGRIIMKAVDPNPSVPPFKRSVLATATGTTEDHAREEVAKIALPLAKERYAEQYKKGMAFKNK